MGESKTLTKSPLDFELPKTDKPIVALDIDEVLFPFVEELCKWMKRVYGSQYKHSDFFSYKFRDVWKCPEEEAIEIVYKYFESEEFHNAKPVVGSVEAVRRLAEDFCIVAVTARQAFLEKTTRAWLHLHYGDAITDACFGNHWVKEKEKGNSVKVEKKDFCKKLKAVALVDDNPTYILEVAPFVAKAILLNIDNANGWGAPLDAPEDVQSKITICCSWGSVVDQLLPLSLK